MIKKIHKPKNIEIEALKDLLVEKGVLTKQDIINKIEIKKRE